MSRYRAALLAPTGAALVSVALASCAISTLSGAYPGRPLEPSPGSRGAPASSLVVEVDRVTPSVAQVTYTPDLLVPTATGARTATARGRGAVAEEDLAPLDFQAPMRERFGVCGDVVAADADWLGAGWYLTWGVELDPDPGGGPAHWQMVRTSHDGYRPDANVIRNAARARPGSTWVIGNEPDVRWQDNTTAEAYAEIYHEVHALLKRADPTCRVAIAAVSQPTPLRLEYLDRVLLAYRTRYGAPMPVDVWNIHNFILREEQGSWGVGIPPGFEASQGALFEIHDHDDIEIFRAQVRAFREWMSSRGQRDKPLVVSEYGVLMPQDYGFGDARVQDFMYATFEFFLAETSVRTGYPADDNRLVQKWAWFSVADETYSTGDLVNLDTRRPTPLGAAFAAYEVPDPRDGS